MSGFEVAGVVLGSIPLLITALEHYQRGISTIRIWGSYRREVRSVTRILETERVRLKDVCEKLLVGIALPCEIECMVEDPFGPAWNEELIQAKIRARLWNSFALFESTVGDMQEAIQEMMRRLDLQPDGKIKWQDDIAVVREFKRLSFVLKRSDYADQLTIIKDGISSIESSIDRSIEMEPKRKVRSQSRLMSLVREVSGSMYRAVFSSFQCSCAHDVHLGLSSRSADISPNDKDEDIIEKIAFRLALNYSAGINTPEISNWSQHVSWEEVHIQALPRETGHKGSQNRIQSNSQQVDGRMIKRVKFSVPQSASESTARMSTTVVHNSFSRLSASCSSARPINRINLCESLRSSHKRIAFDCYGMITDRNEQRYREFGVYPAQNFDRDLWSTASLREVLDQPSKFPPMSITERLHLAVVISSSFLQLHQTHWLPEILTNRDILFLKQGGEFCYKNAFIMNSFPKKPQRSLSAGHSAPNSRSPALLALGILLLELNLGSTIESLRTESETPPDGAASLFSSEYMTADRLLRQKKIESPAYSGATRRCLWGEFAQQQLDLSDENFRHEFYETVVALLEADLKNATWSYGREK